MEKNETVCVITTVNMCAKCPNFVDNYGWDNDWCKHKDASCMWIYDASIIDPNCPIRKKKC